MPPSAPLAEASAVLRLIRPPSTSRLYFWALQATFSDGPRRFGGAHLGLQWNSRHPDSRAVNWGGYDERGVVLDGTVSDLPSTPADPNTRDFYWEPGISYHLRIRPGARGWAGELTDLASGDVTHVRELPAGGRHLTGLMVWTEAFGDCDDPSVAAEWSGFEAVTNDGASVEPTAVRVNYQAYEQGGCSNTTVRREGAGFLQITNAERTIPQGSELPLLPR